MILSDPYGNQQPLRDASGAVVLANNQFANIATDPNGGVPFNEDVPFSSAWLPFGLANTNPAIFGGPGSDQISRKENDERDMRLSFGADFTVPYLDGWEGSATYMFGQRNVVSAQTQHFSFSAVEQGLNCDQVRDAGACFNPFGAADVSPMRTPQAVADAIYTRDRVDNKDTLQTFDWSSTAPSPRVASSYQAAQSVQHSAINVVMKPMRTYLLGINSAMIA